MLSAERRDKRALTRVLAEARASHNVEVQVFALDAHALMAAEAGEPAQARSLLEESDRLAAQVVHVVDDTDRVDEAAALNSPVRQYPTINRHASHPRGTSTPSTQMRTC
jgi:hypothetical protein